MRAYQQKERGILLDIGRKHWSKDQLIELLNKMEKYDFNALQLHFSENLGFRIESKKYPEVVSKEHLTQGDVRELIDEARQRKIEIIPDFDTPGHVDQLLRQYPTFALRKQSEKEQLEPTIGALDITNPSAVSLVFELYREFCELFSESRYFHIGGDEFIDFSKVQDYPTLIEGAKDRFGIEASGLELYVEYVNQLADLIQSNGKIPRIWNDGFYRCDRGSLLQLTKEVEVCYWTRWDQEMASVETWLEKGYRLLNFNDNYFYLVLGEHAGYTYPTAAKIRANWGLNKFASEQLVAEEQQTQVIATYLSVWADQPEGLTCEEILEKLTPIMAEVSKKIRKKGTE